MPTVKSLPRFKHLLILSLACQEDHSKVWAQLFSLTLHIIYQQLIIKRWLHSNNLNNTTTVVFFCDFDGNPWLFPPPHPPTHLLVPLKHPQPAPIHPTWQKVGTVCHTKDDGHSTITRFNYQLDKKRNKKLSISPSHTQTKLSTDWKWKTKDPGVSLKGTKLAWD